MQLGVVPPARYDALRAKRDAVERELQRLHALWATPGNALGASVARERVNAERSASAKHYHQPLSNHHRHSAGRGRYGGSAITALAGTSQKNDAYIIMPRLTANQHWGSVQVCSTSKPPRWSRSFRRSTVYL